MSRLKSHNAGAELRLLETDLLVAQCCPPSRGVHIIRVIVGTGGATEFGEYEIRPRASQRFTHHELMLETVKREALRNALDRLALLQSEADLESIGFDPAEYEEPSRRLLRYRHAGKLVVSALPIPTFFTDHGLGTQLRDRLQERFEESWVFVAEIVGRVRLETGLE